MISNTAGHFRPSTSRAKFSSPKPATPRQRRSHHESSSIRLKIDLPMSSSHNSNNNTTLIDNDSLDSSANFSLLDDDDSSGDERDCKTIRLEITIDSGTKQSSSSRHRRPTSAVVG